MPTEEVTMMMSVVPGAMTGISTLMGGLVSINNVFLDMTRQIDATFGLVDSSIITASTVVAQFGWQAAQAFGEFEQGMKIVQMVSGQTVDDINQLKQAANQFAVEYRTDINQITEGLQTLGRAGLNSATEQTEVLREGLSTAKLESRDLNGVLEELIQNTALLGGDLKTSQFGEQSQYINDLLVATSMTAPITTHDVSETLKYSGGIAAAAGANIDSEEGKRILEDYMGAIAAFAQKGVTGSIAGTALRAFFNKPATQDSSVVEALSSIHLKPEYLWEEGGETMKPVSEQIALIKNQMEELNVSTMDQLQIWSKIVGGKMGQQMMKLDSSDIKNLTKDIQSADNAGDLASGTFKTFQSNMKEMTEQGQVAFRSFGENVAKFLNPVLDIITKILETLSNPVVSMTLFGGFLAFLSLAVGKIKNVFSTLQGEFQQFMTYFQNDEKLLAMRPNTERGLNRKSGGGLRVTTLSSEELKEKHNTPLTGKALLKELDLAREAALERDYGDPEIYAMLELAKQKKFDNRDKNRLQAFLEETYGRNSAEYEKYKGGNILSKDIQNRLGIASIDMDYMIDTLIRERQFDPEWAKTYLNPESEYYQDSHYLLNQHGQPMIERFSKILESRAKKEIEPRSEAEHKIVQLNEQRSQQVMAKLEQGFGLKFWSVNGEGFNPSLLTDNLQEDWDKTIERYEEEFKNNPEALEDFKKAVKRADEIFRKEMQTLTTMYLNYVKEVQTALTLDPEDQPEYIPGIEDKLLLESMKPTQAEAHGVLHDWLYTYGDGSIKNASLLEIRRGESTRASREHADLMEEELRNAKGYPEGYSQDIVDAEEDMAILRYSSKGIPEYDYISSSTIPESEKTDYIRKQLDFIKQNHKDISPTPLDSFPTDKILPDPVNPQDIAGFGDMYENFDEYRKAIVTSFFKWDTFKTVGKEGDVILSPIDSMVDSILKGEQFELSRKEFNDLFIRMKDPITGEFGKTRIGDLEGTGLDIDSMYDIYMYRYNYMRKQAEESLGMFSDYVSGGIKNEDWFKEMEKNVQYNDRGLLKALGYKDGASSKNELFDTIAQLHKEGEIEIDMDWIEKNIKNNERLEKLAYMLGIDPKSFYEGNKLNSDNLLNAIENFDKKDKKSESETKFKMGGDTTYDYGEHHARMVDDSINSFKSRRDRRETTYSGASVDDLEYDYSYHHERNEKYGFSKKQEWQDFADEKVKESKGLYVELNGQLVNLNKELIETGQDVVSLHDSLISFKNTVDEVNRSVRSENQADILGPKGQKSWEYIPEGKDKDKDFLPFDVEMNGVVIPKGTLTSKEVADNHEQFMVAKELSSKVDETTTKVLKNLKTYQAGKRARDFFEKSRPSGSVPTKQDLIEIIAKRDGISTAEYKQGSNSEYLNRIAESQVKLDKIIDRYNSGITNLSESGLRGYLGAPIHSLQYKYNQSIESIKDAYWNWGALKGLKEKADEQVGENKGKVGKSAQLGAIGRNIFHSFFPNALVAGMEGLTAVMELVRQAMEKYHAELKNASSNVKEAFSNISSAESGLSVAYKKQNPDATDEDSEQFVLDMYTQLQKDIVNGKWLEKVEIQTDKMTRYQPDEESEDGSYKMVEEEEKTEDQKYADAIKENTGALYAAIGELQIAMSTFVSKQQDAIWGVDGLSTNLSDTIGKGFLNDEVFGTSGFVEEGNFLLTASQKDDNYSGNKELVGLMLEDFHDSGGYVKEGLETFLGKDYKNVYSGLTGEARQAIWQMAAFSGGNSGLSRSNNLKVQSSMMNDKKSWQSLAKEISKYELKNGRKADSVKNTQIKRLEGYVSKLATETGLSRLQIIQASTLQRMQDMYQVAQETIVPLSAQQAESAAAHYMYATGRQDSNDYQTLQGTAGIQGTASFIASMVSVIAQAKAGEAFFQQKRMEGDPDALAAKNADEYLAGAMDKNYTLGDLGIPDMIGGVGSTLVQIGRETNFLSAADANDMKKTVDKWTHSTNDAIIYTQKGDPERGVGWYMTLAQMGEKARNPNWSDTYAWNYALKKGEKEGILKLTTDDKGRIIPELADGISVATAMKTARENYSGAVTPALIEQYMGSGIGDTENSNSGGGSGSGSGNDKNEGTRKERVDLVLCNKKEIPKLNVNLFKKPPTFTVLNKNFKLRDVKINTEDKPKIAHCTLLLF